jgi:ribonuclease P protein component
MNFRDDERLRKQERLLEREDYLNTQSEGQRRSTRHLILYARPNGRDYARLGITASRKVGQATTRNWWKRRIREIFRRNKREFPGGYDFVVIVKSSPDQPPFEALRDELLEALNRCASAA